MRAWSELTPLPASEGDWLLPRLRGFGTVGGVVGSHWPRYAVLPPAPGERGSDGELQPETAAALREVLGRHTDDPDDCVVALWEGWGCVPAVPLDVPRLAPPHRGYLLFGATLAELDSLPVAAADAWPGRASPTLCWPRSHAWCVGVEIDVVVTLVGGGDALVDEVLALPGAQEVDSIDRLRREWHAPDSPWAAD